MTSTSPNGWHGQFKGKVGVFTRRLKKNKHLLIHLLSDQIIRNPSTKQARSLNSVLGWGLKDNTLKARRYAAKNNLQFLALEDGFIHSMSQGRLGAQSWSLVIDSTGIYYDARAPSDLEKLILDSTVSNKEKKIAMLSISKITELNITKYNNTKRTIPDSLKKLKDTVLVVDQVDGDLSIKYSLAEKHSFQHMYEAALRENPTSNILIKTHPDVINGKKRGCIDLQQNLPKNVQIITENINSLLLIKQARSIYVVSSQMGFDALLLRKRVICFGAPFYAGWGLTDDRLDPTLPVFERRNKSIDIETLFYLSYYQYSSYIHPDKGSPCTLEDILNYVELQFRINDHNRGKLYCIGFTPWKKKFIREYLKSTESTIFFPSNANEAIAMGFDKSSVSCLWSFKHEKEAALLHSSFKTPVWRIEDGFIRSVSLGSNYTLPASLVVDKSGLYFDATNESDLEKILSKHEFSEKDRERASALRLQLISQAVSKYNVGRRNTEKLPTNTEAKCIILIPGQVSDDASISKGCLDINTNIKLIKEVRKTNPSGFIIYKPHPDVLSGNREGYVPKDLLMKYCDLVIEDISITDCLSQVQEVHTMTSLVGFEALIRGLKVHCYGIPFYSGWGLTTDRHKCTRRNRKLCVDELVAGVLLLYPLYFNWQTKRYTTPEVVIGKIHEQIDKLQKKNRFISAVPSKLAALEKKFSLLKIILSTTPK